MASIPKTLRNQKKSERFCHNSFDCNEFRKKDSFFHFVISLKSEVKLFREFAQILCEFEKGETMQVFLDTSFLRDEKKCIRFAVATVFLTKLKCGDTGHG
jgi:hypothetical protein